MGLFSVTGRLTGPGGRSEEVELLVDTGATQRLVPVEGMVGESRAALEATGVHS